VNKIIGLANTIADCACDAHIVSAFYVFMCFFVSLWVGGRVMTIGG